MFNTSIGRVDPCAVCADNTSTPMEIASRDIDRKEVLAILGEFTEMPLSVKLEHLSRLMYGDETKEERKAEFQKLLSSLPVESVRAKNLQFFSSFFISYISRSTLYTAKPVGHSLSKSKFRCFAVCKLAWKLNPFKVNTSDVRSYGTLLQDAVYEDKRDFIRILLDFGFVSFLNNGPYFSNMMVFIL